MILQTLSSKVPALKSLQLPLAKLPNAVVHSIGFLINAAVFFYYQIQGAQNNV